MDCPKLSTAILVLACILLILWLPADASAADPNSAGTKDLYEMSIAELMNVEIVVPATITEKDPLKTPASVTVITAEDIARTPARNMLDLLETYVPGAFYMNHSVGPLPGIRGVLVDRPYKFLVNINGVNINIKSHYGARLELLNWDLNDISRIEIIRGPGSVIYGPGAIGGVINIYTKTARESPRLHFGGTWWDKYDSVGNYVSYGHDANEMSAYGYLSIVDTQGTRPDLFGVTSSTSGYVGNPGGPYSPNPPFTYLADFYDEPQIKAHIDVHLQDNWRAWARYVTSSSSLIQNSGTKYLIDGKWQDLRQTRYRYIQFALENNRPLNDVLSLDALFGIHSTDVHNVEKYSGTIDNNKDNLQNIGWIWSEWQYFTRFMLNYNPEAQWIRAAAGFEFSYDTVRPAWGKNEDDGLRLADGIMSGPSSDAYGTGFRQFTEANKEYFAVGNGWETQSGALLGELNLQWTPKTTTLLSARLDKHSYTDYMFSPRVAWMYELDRKEYLKLIAQRSVRRNTEEELYMNHELGENNDPEKLDSLELIYSSRPTEAISFQTSAFLNRNDVIAWDWGLRRSAPVGTLDTFGLEAETQYKRDNLTVGLNHSFVKQIDWDLDDSLAVSGISYSEYYRNAGGGVIITSNGNDLNNWPNHATKMFSNIGFLNGKLLLHANMRVLWGFQGSQDGLDALETAGGTASSIADIRRHNAYDPEVTANMSLTYRFNKHVSVMAFVENIALVGDNKRYSYSSGFKNAYPDKVSWIEEPTVVGLAYRAEF